LSLQWERELIALTSKLAQFVPPMGEGLIALTSKLAQFVPPVGEGVNSSHFEIGTICPLSLRERVRVRAKPH
jgi:hypothetical protein